MELAQIQLAGSAGGESTGLAAEGCADILQSSTTYLYVQALVLQGRFEALHLGAESRAVATPVPGLFLSEVCCGLQISQEVDYGTCLANSGLG